MRTPARKCGVLTKAKRNNLLKAQSVAQDESDDIGVFTRFRGMPKYHWDAQYPPIPHSPEPKRPPAKRARRGANPREAKGPAKSAAPRKPAVEQTSTLMCMPLDIWFEILKQLDVGALHALSHTCTNLQDTLASPQAAHIWKDARAGMGDSPSPPLGTPEARWAVLVFGGNRCQNCGTTSVNKIDWQLLMRVCSACKKANPRSLFTSNKFAREFAGADAVYPHPPYASIHIPPTHLSTPSLPLASLLDNYLTPGIPVGGWATRASETTYYWRGDVERMLGIVARYKEDIEAKKPGAKEAYKEFRERRIARVISVMQLAPEYCSWHEERQWKNKCAGRDLAKERKEGIRARLLQIGHDPRDVERAMTTSEIEIEKRELTDASWRRIKKKWEAEVARARRRRLLTDHPAVIAQRKRAAAQVYNEAYRKTIGPREWFTSLDWLALPRSSDVVKLEPFWEPSYTDVGVSVPDADFQKALRHCGGEIRSMKRRNESNLRWRFDDLLTQVKEGGVLLEDAGIPVFSLAVAICQKRWHPREAPFEQCLGAMELLFLSSQSGVDYWPEYRVDLSRAVVALLDVLELSPATTTFTELDQLDARFFCSHCPAQDFGGTWTRLAFRWRSAVLHYNKEHAEQKETPKFRLLSESEADCARKSESSELAEANTWSCGHCGEHLDNWQPRLEVEAHVKESHDILAPKMDVDVLCMPIVLVNIKPLSSTLSHSQPHYNDLAMSSHSTMNTNPMAIPALRPTLSTARNFALVIPTGLHVHARIPKGVPGKLIISTDEHTSEGGEPQMWSIDIQDGEFKYRDPNERSGAEPTQQYDMEEGLQVRDFAYEKAFNPLPPRERAQTTGGHEITPSATSGNTIPAPRVAAAVVDIEALIGEFEYAIAQEKRLDEVYLHGALLWRLILLGWTTEDEIRALCSARDIQALEDYDAVCAERRASRAGPYDENGEYPWMLKSCSEKRWHFFLQMAEQEPAYARQMVLKMREEFRAELCRFEHSRDNNLPYTPQKQYQPDPRNPQSRIRLPTPDIIVRKGRSTYRLKLAAYNRMVTLERVQSTMSERAAAMCGQTKRWEQEDKAWEEELEEMWEEMEEMDEEEEDQTPTTQVERKEKVAMHEQLAALAEERAALEEEMARVKVAQAALRERQAALDAEWTARTSEGSGDRVSPESDGTVVGEEDDEYASMDDNGSSAVDNAAPMIVDTARPSQKSLGKRRMSNVEGVEGQASPAKRSRTSPKRNSPAPEPGPSTRREGTSSTEREGTRPRRGRPIERAVPPSDSNIASLLQAWSKDKKFSFASKGTNPSSSSKGNNPSSSKGKKRAAEDDAVEPHEAPSPKKQRVAEATNTCVPEGRNIHVPNGKSVRVATLRGTRVSGERSSVGGKGKRLTGSRSGSGSGVWKTVQSIVNFFTGRKGEESGEEISEDEDVEDTAKMDVDIPNYTLNQASNDMTKNGIPSPRTFSPPPPSHGTFRLTGNYIVPPSCASLSLANPSTWAASPSPSYNTTAANKDNDESDDDFPRFLVPHIVPGSLTSWNGGRVGAWPKDKTAEQMTATSARIVNLRQRRQRIPVPPKYPIVVTERLVRSPYEVFRRAPSGAEEVFGPGVSATFGVTRGCRWGSSAASAAGSGSASTSGTGTVFSLPGSTTQGAVAAPQPAPQPPALAPPAAPAYQSPAVPAVQPSALPAPQLPVLSAQQSPAPSAGQPAASPIGQPSATSAPQASTSANASQASTSTTASSRRRPLRREGAIIITDH
ncbi:uncharacterized protein SCHCODRAFT_02504360 [Schizophyllum commune H4-8]|nr:uncharacterized protein SCHCODRAFT_02504360 [Schizophyllum commune H4-8]KAI5891267.1 hypothetical protein SCHCODRAFT_02504360 [Schizophyllum commune H4-8]